MEANEQTKRLTLRSITEKAKVIADATEHRDMMIRAASAEGVSLREIAEAAGVSHMTIKRVVEAHD